MSTLEEIEAATDALTADQKRELLLYIAAKLRADGASEPAPRNFSIEQVKSWIDQDQADMRRFREEK